MAETKNRNKKALISAIFWGIISIAMYFALLSNQELVNNNFTVGGLSALLPIATAFAFSFVHGNFTSDFWSALGVEAAKKKGGK